MTQVHTPSNAPRLHTRAEIVRETTRDGQLKLMDENAKMRAEMAPFDANDPTKVLEKAGVYAGGFLKRMEQVSKELTQRLRDTKWEQRMEKAFEDSPATVKALEAILAKLDTDVQEADDGKSGRHPYIEARYIRVKGTHPIPNWGISTAIYDDAQFLNEALATRGITQEQRGILEEMGRTLETYAMNDIQQMDKQRFIAGRKNNYTDNAIKQMGKMAGVLVFGAAAILTGVMSIANRKVSAAPLLYAGLAAFLASPDLAKSIFGGQYQTALGELNKSVNSEDFKAAAKKHTIHGPGGAKIAQAYIHPSPQMDSYIGKVRAETVTPEDTQAMASVINSPVTGRESYDMTLELLEDHEAALAFTKLSNLEDPDAIETAMAYLETGASKYYRTASQKIQAAEQEVLSREQQHA